MTFSIPDDLLYLESHEWLAVTNGTGRVGITDFAQDELGDIVFVELPAVGDSVSQGDAFGVIESIKAVSDLYAPVSGEVTAVNSSLEDAPELVNDDPYDEGWMLELSLADDTETTELLSPSKYQNQIQ